jgi:hypothetical protein
LFDDDVTSPWSGLPLIRDAQTAPEFLAGAWFYPAELQYGSFHEETRDRVRVGDSVVFEQSEGDVGMNGRTATFTAIWRRDADGKCRLHLFEHLKTSTR